MLPGEKVPVANGDRILVLKCIYQFEEPKRWDVIVFKNPINPSENYIKRLIGLPRETIEIIDGDVYIDGLIARKPPQVQKELWMPLYDHDFQPVNPNDRAGFNGQRWQPPFDLDGSAWRISDDNPTQLVLDCPPDQPSVLAYGVHSDRENSFAATYAYDEVFSYGSMPMASDLMVRFYVNPAAIRKRTDRRYACQTRDRLQGLDRYERLDDSGEGERRPGNHSGPQGNRAAFAGRLHAGQVRQRGPPAPVRIRWQRAVPRSRDGRRKRWRKAPQPSPRAEIFGAGKLTLSHVALFRDVHYTGGEGGRPIRAVENRPFHLNQDEFFVLGDNSPNSEDGRWWGQPRVASRGWEPPRAGVVPRYYLVGKALFVYWPSGFDFPWPQRLKDALITHSGQNAMMRILHGIVSLRWIPNVGQMRFIYGGSPDKAGPPPQAADK